MENILDTVKEAWGWTGIQPDEVISDNAFGNLIVKDIKGKYWRICPEDAYCKAVAENQKELKALSSDEEFLEDWNMEALLEKAKAVLGDLTEGNKYCFVIPGVLGGEYGIDNIRKAPLEEVIGISGDIGKQIVNLPEDSKVILKVND